MTDLVFIDTETTSVRHDRRAWEIALIVRTDDGDIEHQWFIDDRDLDLGNADPKSLAIGRFYQRHPDYAGTNRLTYTELSVMQDVERLTRGAHLVGAVPNFDAEVIGAQMRDSGICPSWHYHLVDVETLAAGALRIQPPWGFDDILKHYGLTYDEANRHTALGDTRMVRDLYDAVLAGVR